ncbi:transporter substrate-binding domain-containing protein [Pseudoduganella sp. LjRoot289]|uniref:substrate-binding periplasmic protein n=1 Tax=Pseudoduganella sp. LjRoot289 TaxID=3342314 RepID=UPI003ECE5B51
MRARALKMAGPLLAARAAGLALALALTPGAGPMAAAPGPAGAAELEPLRFAAEDWPPFVTASMPNNGLSGALVGAVFERIGYAVHIDYFPWKRTMELGLNSPRYTGFMAVWRTPEREQQCHFSSAIGSTLTVLAYLKEAPVQAASVADLRSLRIGTVAGYANGERFDALVKAGELRTEEGVNDETNLRKLLMRRFPAIVVEKRVLRHLLSDGHFSKAERERIVYSDKLFRERTVHLCFKRNGEGVRLQQAFNDAARDVDLLRIERDYWRRVGDDALPPRMQ